MRERQILGKSLALAVALCLAVVLAAPVLAGGGGPPARTGNLHDDCSNFSLSSNKKQLSADCRTSDDNTDTTSRTITYGSNVQSNDSGNLECGSGALSCDHRTYIYNFRLDTSDENVVRLRAHCFYWGWSGGTVNL